MADASAHEDELMDLVARFVGDLIPTFPEISEALEMVLAQTEAEFLSATVRAYAQSFFQILQKNGELFTEATGPLHFLPGIDFRQLWEIEGLSEGTRDAIWRHLQLIMFELIPKISDKAEFGDSASLFEAITPEQLQEELEAAFANLEGDEDGGEDAEAAANQFTEHISGLMGGSLGRLANEIAEEVGHDLGLTRSATQKEVMDLLKDPTRMIKLVKKIGQKLQEKIDSGEVKESELLEEAAGVMDKMKNIPGAERLQKMFGGAANSKASKAATGAALKQRIGKAKTRERLQAKLAAKRAEMAAVQATAMPEGGDGSVAMVGRAGAASASADANAAPRATSNVNEWLPQELQAPQQRSAPRRKKDNKKKR